MYLPAYLKKQLTTPEDLCFEQTRRTLKHAVSEAAKAVRNYRRPIKSVVKFTAVQKKDWNTLLLFRAGKVSVDALGTSLAHVRTDIKNTRDRDAELARLYALTLAYENALAEHPAKLEALRQAEADARQAYADHLNTAPASDLE